MRRKPFPGETAEDFAIAWDKELGAVAGFGELEKKREKYIARRLFELSGGYSSILAIVELPRMDGIVAELETLAAELSKSESGDSGTKDSTSKDQNE